MQALMIANQKTVALGNAKMNARGDLLGKGGKIVKTREELNQEYNKNPVNKVITVPVTSSTLSKSKEQPAKKKPEKQKSE